MEAENKIRAKPFLTVPEAIAAFRRGDVLICTDDEKRENEGDFITAAASVTPEIVNFMATYGRGLICAPMTAARADALALRPMVEENTSLLGTAFTVSVDAADGTTTGISAADRALTLRLLAAESTRPEDLARPGHISPLRAAAGGVLERAGHTEAVVDLARMAGLAPAGVLCEIMNADGTMARMPHLKEIAARFNLGIITIRDIIEYRGKHERTISRLLTTTLPTKYGEFVLHVYGSAVNPQEHHLALVIGEVAGKENVLVRVHSQCLTGDVFHSLRCDCGEQIEKAMQMIAREGMGVLLYMRQEGRGIGLVNKIKTYILQDEGVDTVDANVLLGFKPDERHYGVGAQILVDLGLSSLRIMTNNPMKMVGLEAYGLVITERVPLEIEPNAVNRAYLKTKKERMGHILSAENDKDAGLHD